MRLQRTVVMIAIHASSRDALRYGSATTNERDQRAGDVALESRRTPTRALRSTVNLGVDHRAWGASPKLRFSHAAKRRPPSAKRSAAHCRTLAFGRLVMVSDLS